MKLTPMKSTRTGLVAIAAVLLTASACGGSDGSDGSDTSKSSSLGLVEDGTLTVCSALPFAPFEDYDESSPTGFKGFDIDISQAVADGLGVELKVTNSSFDPLQSGLALNSGQCDMVASAMTITDERAERMAFSDPYYDADQSLLVSADSAYDSLDDLNGQTIGVSKGTTGEAYANEHATGAEVMQYPNQGQAFQALKAGTIDGIVQDLPVNVDVAKKNPSYTVVETFETGEHYGLVIKKTNTELLDEVNRILEEMRSDGSYDELYDTYFKAPEQ